MSYADLSQPVVVNRPLGEALKFQRCTPTDWMKFRDTLRTYRKVYRAASCQIVGIVGRDVMPYLDELDARHLDDDDVADWLNEPEGQREAILMSMQKTKPDATLQDVDALGLEREEKLAVAAGVFKVPIIKRTLNPGESPLPPSPASGAASETGEGKPSQSAPEPESPNP